MTQPAPKKFPDPRLLLHPNIPKPLHGVNPRTLKGGEWWDIERKKAYAKHDEHCWACGVHKSQAIYRKWLEAHEHYTVDYQNGRMYIVEIVALCHACHNFIHNGRMYNMFQQGDSKMPRAKIWHVLHYGFSILKARGLPPNPFALTVAYNLSIDDTEKPKWADTKMLESLCMKHPMPEENPNIVWRDWRLVFEGVEYEPLHKNAREWMKFYNANNLDSFAGFTPDDDFITTPDSIDAMEVEDGNESAQKQE